MAGAQGQGKQQRILAKWDRLGQGYLKTDDWIDVIWGERIGEYRSRS